MCFAYNEEEVIKHFLKQATRLLEENVEDYEIVLVDDGSIDKTSLILSELAKHNPNLRVFTNEKNMNIGYSAKRAFCEARKEILFWHTVDWSYDLKNLRIFLELTNYFDVVWGVRPVPERLLNHIPLLRSVYRVKTRSDNLLKEFVSLVNYYILHLFLV